MLRYIIRPLGPWTEPVTTDRLSASTFRASWDDTLKLLREEVEQLDGTQVVLQLDADPDDIRLDGMLRSRAEVRFPGVRVSFDSRHGPLTYSTDAYEQRYYSGLTSWQANVRAIALSLKALRAVDRYGVTRRGEQYTGWTAISNREHQMTREQAAEFIATWAANGYDHIHVLTQPTIRDKAYRDAAKRAHPDVTGDNGDTMARLNAARDLLNAGSQ